MDSVEVEEPLILVSGEADNFMNQPLAVLSLSPSLHVHAAIVTSRASGSYKGKCWRGEREKEGGKRER